MKKIQIKEAKASLSAVVDEAEKGNGAIITRHGRPTAVLISFAEYEKLKQVPSFGWLLANAPLDDTDLEERSQPRAYRDDLF